VKVRERPRSGSRYIEPTHREARGIGEESRDYPATHGSVDEAEAEFRRYIANGGPKVEGQDLPDEQTKGECSHRPKEGYEPSARPEVKL
jgi:hypothetical protein